MDKIKRGLASLAVVTTMAMPMYGCATDAQTGGLLGAGAGAVIGHQEGRGLEGAAIGGVLGAIAGKVFGKDNMYDAKPIERDPGYNVQDQMYR